MGVMCRSCFINAYLTFYAKCIQILPILLELLLRFCFSHPLSFNGNIKSITSFVFQYDISCLLEIDLMRKNKNIKTDTSKKG
jgi:hypothetical protein